jgi:AcrR family transcriptional regulator
MESQSELHKPSLRPRRKQQDRREEATRRILESAIALVCEKGMVGVTMREIGVRAGCSRALATHHYGHKEGLLVALVEKVGADIRAARQASGRRKPGLESVLGIVGFYLGQNPSHDKALRALHIILSEEVATEGPVASALERLNKESLAQIESQLRVGIQEGEIRADIDPVAESVAILGAMRGISMQFMFGLSDVSAVRVRDAAVTTIERGLRSATAA